LKKLKERKCNKMDNSLSAEDKRKISFQDIIAALKELTLQERRLLEKELVMMRLDKEFNFIKDKFAERRQAKGGKKHD